MIQKLSHDELERQLYIATCQGWNEITFDIRTEMQRRIVRRELK